MYTEFGQADVVCVTDVGDVQAGEGGDWQGRGAAEVIKVNYAFRFQILLLAPLSERCSSGAVVQ